MSQFGQKPLLALGNQRQTNVDYMYCTVKNLLVKVAHYLSQHQYLSSLAGMAAAAAAAASFQLQ